MDSFARFLSYVFLITAMLGIGLKVRVADVQATLHQRRFLLRSLVANFVYIPALGFLIVFLVPMPTDIAVGFILLAVTPGGLSALQYLGGSPDKLFIEGALTFILSLLAIFISPAIAGAVLPIELRLAPVHGPAIRFLLLYLLLPLLAGLAIRQKLPKPAEKLSKLMIIAATLAITAFGFLLATKRQAALAALDWTVLSAMAAFILGSMVIGWISGGPAREMRAVLATASSMRNCALCYFIAIRSFPGKNVDVAVIAFSFLMVPPNSALSFFEIVWKRRKKISTKIKKIFSSAEGKIDHDRINPEL